MSDPRRELIDRAFEDRALLRDDACREAVLSIVEDLDQGRLRVATRDASEEGDDAWRVHAWVQRAVVLYFSVAPMVEGDGFDGPRGSLPFHDKVPLKRGLAAAGVRVVPGAVVRYGSFCERGVVVMPGFVNIGAFVGSGTMVDTWATVGSCAQIGRGVHLSGGVGIGGVLEPPGARPVIIEDHAFIGSRCIVVEGVTVGEGAVLGAGVVLTKSTPVIDVRQSEAVVTKGRIPARSVVIPGTRKKRFPAGEFELPAALIIGERSSSTDEKTSLNDTLREFAL
ncbi:MAG: 2,3,4,5-tetrahydropyridine-2,6-dicarboxylate N-succinyltransferase [Planctomycetes bacterium]|nr:2,3,4,5-tetrahydropyridine-2,6-dicarboxylate N-succinyltransferase [Planctomycetota bacterium]